MPKLELTSDEKIALIDVLETAISDLGVEIAGTESADYRSGLKSTKQAVMAVLDRLQKTDD